MTRFDEDGLADFESQRRHLRAIAYRMLASRADAEDAVQDAWLRWHATARAQVQDARAFLAQTVTRLCLDRIKSAQARREVYVGTWLPEPLVDDDDSFQPGPDVAHERARDLSFAFLLTLQRLSSLERASFLLHDVFEMAYDEIAPVLGRSEAACRQLASRARVKVRVGPAPVPQAAPAAVNMQLAAAFIKAVRDGDVAALAAALAEDATFLSDGGGRVAAVPYTLQGRDTVARVIMGFAGKLAPEQFQLRLARINGLPGLVISTPGGGVIQTLAFEPDARLRIAAIYVMRNPDKLQSVQA